MKTAKSPVLRDHHPKANFRLVYDPSPYPLVEGLVIPTDEVVYGLKLRAFTPGTLLIDLKTGSLHTVKQDASRLCLDPAVPRVERCIGYLYGKRNNSPSRRSLYYRPGSVSIKERL